MPSVSALSQAVVAENCSAIVAAFYQWALPEGSQHPTMVEDHVPPSISTLKSWLKKRRDSQPQDFESLWQDAQFWQHLEPRWDSVLTKVAAGEAMSVEEDALLRISMVLVELCLEWYKKPAHPSMHKLVQRLHEILLSIQDNPSLQDASSRLCELWFTKGCQGKEEVSVQTLSYLLMRSIDANAKQVDLKRVYAMRSALQLFDYEDESSEAFSKLIMYCFVSPSYTRFAEGRKFLAFAFQLHPDLGESIHTTIKNQIPSASKATLDAYAEVYLRAWKMAEDPVLSRIEYVCIQDLMNHAVHASNTGGKNSPAQKLRRLLSPFHDQQNKAKTDAMLCRLYEPILWRALNVANPVVRRNATTLLAEVFPLQNPDGSAEEMNASIQKQFDHLATLLKDPNAEVRSVAVQGLCRIFAVFWEWAPSEVVNDLLKVICNELAFDAASADVRLSVIEGIRYIVENMPLSHTTIKRYLKSVGKLVHDTNYRNRVALLDLLLVVRDIPDIKFWDVVDLPHLLYRLENDSADICKRITSLLVNSFFPLKKDVGVKISRGIVMFEKNPHAARQFYYFLLKYVDVKPVLEFALGLYEALHYVVDLPEGAQETVLSNAKDGAKKSAKKREGKPKKEDASEEFMTAIRSHFDSLLDILAILLEKLLPVLGEEGMEEWRAAAVESFELYPLDKLVEYCQSEIGVAAIYHIAKYALAANFLSLSERCQEGLVQGTSVSPVQASMLECLFTWGLGSQVVDSCLSWLDNSPLAQPFASSSSTAKRVRGSSSASKSKSAWDAMEDEWWLALDYLNVILGNVKMRNLFLDAEDDEESSVFAKMMALLQPSLTQLEEVLQSENSDSDAGKFLLTAAVVFFKYAVHRGVLNSTDPVLEDTMERLGEVLDEFPIPAGLMGSPNSKKRALESGSNELILEGVLAMSMELLLLGVGKSKGLDLGAKVADMAKKLVKSANPIALPIVGRWMVEFVQRIGIAEADGNECLTMLLDLLKTCIQSLESDQIEENPMLPLLNGAMSEMNQWMSTDAHMVVFKQLLESIVRAGDISDKEPCHSFLLFFANRDAQLAHCLLLSLAHQLTSKDKNGEEGDEEEIKNKRIQLFKTLLASPGMKKVPWKAKSAAKKHLELCEEEFVAELLAAF